MRDGKGSEMLLGQNRIGLPVGAPLLFPRQRINSISVGKSCRKQSGCRLVLGFVSLLGLVAIRREWTGADWMRRRDGKSESDFLLLAMLAFALAFDTHFEGGQARKGVFSHPAPPPFPPPAEMSQ